ncbi:hypothetical protein ADUPG1_009485, partial [Aduncisulcus paluster]
MESVRHCLQPGCQSKFSSKKTSKRYCSTACQKKAKGQRSYTRKLKEKRQQLLKKIEKYKDRRDSESFSQFTQIENEITSLNGKIADLEAAIGIAEVVSLCPIHSSLRTGSLSENQTRLLEATAHQESHLEHEKHCLHDHSHPDKSSKCIACTTIGAPMSVMAASLRLISKEQALDRLEAFFRYSGIED